MEHGEKLDSLMRAAVIIHVLFTDSIPRSVLLFTDREQ